MACGLLMMNNSLCMLVRFAALLHDVGPTPFSHASEYLFPEQENGTRYKHENYSAAIVRTEIRKAIEDHQLNVMNYGFKAEDIAALPDCRPALEALALTLNPTPAT
jgi:uncharacterized protein